jgi:cystathionine beta-lyase/cystathionine gamma-synthase
MRFATRAIHAGQPPDPATGATIPPIYQTSTYTQEAIGRHKGYEYSRSGNPTRAALEACIAALEEGRHGLAFASGLAATNAVLQLLSAGDHIVAGEDLYGGTIRLFERVFGRFGVTSTLFDAAEPAAFEAALRPTTRLLWLESPTNPLLTVYDIGALAERARARGLIVVVDNTFATPYLQRPLRLGASIALHSTTKYLGGHSDVIGGAVALDDPELHERLKFVQNASGGVPGPFDCWLVQRGIKTLAVRMAAHEANARRIAERLAGHPAVGRLYYPGFPDHPGHAIARRQMSGFGGMVSLELAGGRPAVDRFLARLRVFQLAESLGGVESLVCHPATMTHAIIPAAERERRGITDALLRLSVGIEDGDDLVEDLVGALEG